MLELRYDKSEGYEECLFVFDTTGKNTKSIEIIKKYMSLLEWINKTKEEIEEEIERISKPYSEEYTHVIHLKEGNYETYYSSGGIFYPTAKYLSYTDAKRLNDELNRLGG